MRDFLLTFEQTEDPREIDICGNRAGFLYLAKLLTELAESKTNNHVHLMSESWGGDLPDEVQGMTNQLVHHIRITVWVSPDDGAVDRSQ